MMQTDSSKDHMKTINQSPEDPSLPEQSTSEVEPSETPELPLNDRSEGSESKESLPPPDEQVVKVDREEAESSQANETVVSNRESPADPFKDLADQIGSGFSRVLAQFEQKVAYDATKQQQIDRLHEELQQHKMDLIAKTSRPLLNGLIRLYNDTGRTVANLKKKPPENLDPEEFFKAIHAIQEDIEILLDQHDVTPFEVSEDVFQPKKQRKAKSIPTPQHELVGKVAERLSSGFERREEIVQKEKVSVYVLSEKTQDAAGSQRPEPAQEPCIDVPIASDGSMSTEPETHNGDSVERQTRRRGEIPNNQGEDNV